VVERVDWHTYFMNIAHQAATRSTCDRKHVGAVIVRDKTILSTGYNGSIRGMPHCDDVGHLMEDGHCVATVHAEAKRDHPGREKWRTDRWSRNLYDSVSMLGVLQADLERRPAEGVLR
jgi:hypothetical protein